MKFDELNAMIPYTKGGKEKVLTMEPYPGIVLAMPGRHAKDTTPVGGDFVVMVTAKEKDWKRHQFTHVDLFRDIENRLLSSKGDQMMRPYLEVILGADPDSAYTGDNKPIGLVLKDMTFLHTVQCLAVAEHRRYNQYESAGGGRYLPFRFATGIHELLWSAETAALKQKWGRPSVERLEKQYGTPKLTEELLSRI